MKAQMQEVIGKISTDLTLSADSATYIEELYEQYLLAPETLSEDWQRYFGNFLRRSTPRPDQTTISGSGTYCTSWSKH
jgi:2-oxoglutarate dehydrogenase E1 component